MQRTTTINDRYITSEPLGGGGMAQVFLAHDKVLERDVAVKVLHERYAENEEFVERFRREALSVASLSHPNIVQVYDRGVAEDGRYYIAMEYVPGGTLGDRLRRDGPLSPRVAAAVAAQIADALDAAHERGLIHRDVKPQNVLVTASGDVKVADFGIARAVAADAVSRTDEVLGTARYMSPEQAMGREAGPPSDLYSLGVVLYEMLTAEVPFEADSPVAISIKHIDEPPRPPREIRGEIPDEINAVVLKLLAKSPEARYASAAALAADLDRIVGGTAPAGETRGGAQTEPLRPAPVAGRYGRRRKVPRLLAALAFLVLLGGLGWGLLAGPNLGEIVGTLKGLPGQARAEAEEVRRAVAPSDVRVPDVEDLDEGAARRRLDEAGLGAAVRDRRSNEERAGQVLEQSVPAGKRVEEGSRILLAVSSGPGGQQNVAADTASSDQPEGSGGTGVTGVTDGPNEPNDPSESGGEGVGDAGAASASPEPSPNTAPDAGQGTNRAPLASPEPSSPEPSSPEPSPREAPASTPPSPAPSSPEPASPESASPEPASPEPSSPEPSSPEPASPAPSSPEPSSPAPSSPAPSSPAPSAPAPPGPSSPPPSSSAPSEPRESSAAPAPPEPASPEPSSPEPSSSAPSSPAPASVGASSAEAPSPED